MGHARSPVHGDKRRAARAADGGAQTVRLIALFDRPSLFSDLWDSETAAYLPGQVVGDLDMPGNSLDLAICGTEPKGMASTFSLQIAAMMTKVT